MINTRIDKLLGIAWLNKYRADHRAIFAIALPMILSNIAAPLLGLVDTAIIGHLDHNIYLGAVALGAMVVSFTYLLAIFLRMSTTAEAAHAFGAGDEQAIRQLLIHALLICIGLGVVLLSAGPWLVKLAWWLIQPSADLAELAGQYIQIRLLAAPAALINLAVLGILLGQQRSKQAMSLIILMNLVNLAADVVLVIGLQLNVIGAAWASVIAESTVAMVGLVWLRQWLILPSKWRVEPAKLKQFVHMNGDIFVRSLLLQLCMATMTGYAAKFGTVVVAANAVLMQFLMLISLGLDGIAYAVEALVGAARGRKDRQQIRHWMKLTLTWSALFALVYCLAFALTGNWIITQITHLPDVITTAQTYLPWLIALPLLAHWSYYYDGVFVGLGLTRGMRNSMAISALGVFLPAVLVSQWLLSKSNANHGLWLALSLFLLARGITQAYLLHRYKIIHQD
ncbi:MULTISPECIES: MATE family efflux transporter [Pseudidiomarina]|nr:MULTISPECIES: MATE family efflux transporter [Pseudidiomarina]